MPVRNALQEPVYFLSGLYFPIRSLGPLGYAAAGLLPLTIGVDALRQVRDALPELSDQGHLDFLNDVYETGEPVYGRQRAFARLGGQVDAKLLDVIIRRVLQSTGVR